MIPKTWHEARLIPTSGIGSAQEQERRATSALLAVLGAVGDFGRAILKSCGAPAGKIETYIEVPFELDKRQVRPDGLIRVSRGKRQWTALVEVKTGKNDLAVEQVEAYLDVAKEQKFDAVITISNEIPPVLGAHPLQLDKRKLKTVDVFHFSWVRIISMAVMEKEVHGIDDPEQAWILGELIRYLEHENSGALDFSDMGASWIRVRDAARKGVIRKGDPEVEEIAVRFDALIRFACLRLGQRLGTEVLPQLPRRHIQNPSERTAELVEHLNRDSCLAARIRIPDTVADIEISCDLRGQQIHVSATVPASGHARSDTRVRWLLRQLGEDQADLVVEAIYRGRGVAADINEIRADEKVIIPDASKEITWFRVTKIYPMGVARSTRSSSSFISSVTSSVDHFYAEILQKLKPWTPPAPRFRDKPAERIAGDELASADLSSVDEPEPVSLGEPRD